MMEELAGLPAPETDKDQFFILVYFDEKERMRLCNHTHDSLQEARDCAKGFIDPAAIIEWQRNRTPQFQEAEFLLIDA